nr:hypothetical protein [Ectobacillus ponti]
MLLTSLIFTSNTLLYRLDAMQPLPSSIGLASLFDCIIVVPLLAYFFIIRNRYPVKYVVLAALAGYAAATFIIPKQHLEAYSFVRYILFAGEGAFVLLELYILYQLLTKVPAFIRHFRQSQADIPAFPYRLEQALAAYFPQSRTTAIYATELAIYYYSLFSWRNKTPSQVLAFTYHKKTGGIALYVMLIHAMLIESIGLHVLLHGWSPIASYVALFLNAYTILLFLAEIQAIRLAPFMVTDRMLYLQAGVMKRLAIPFTAIKSIHSYEGPEKLSREEEKHVFDGVLADFMKEKPLFEIEFHEPQRVHMLYGFSKQVTKAHVRPDDGQAFYEAVASRLVRE